MGTFVTQTDAPTLFESGPKQAAPNSRLPTGWTTRNVPEADDLNAIHNALMDLRAEARGGSSQWINIKHKGAVGDGSTDDTEAIQDAIDSLTDGGVVYFPPGVYKISAEMVPSFSVPIAFVGPCNPTAFAASGSGGAIIRQTGGALLAAVDLNHSSPASTNTIRFENLSFEGSGTARCGFDAAQTKNVSIRNCRFFNFAGPGITANRNSFFWRLDNVEFDTCERAIYSEDTINLSDPACLNGGTFKNLNITNTSKDAFYIQHSGAFFMESVIWEICGSSGVNGGGYFKTCVDFQVHHAYVERTYGDSLTLDGCSRFTVGNSRFNNQELTGSEKAIRIKDSSRGNVANVSGRYANAIVYLEGSHSINVDGVSPVAESTTHINYLVLVDANSYENTVKGCSAVGMKLGGVRVNGSYNTITTNAFSGTLEGGGIHVTGSYNTIVGNVVRNCCASASTTADAGIYISNGLDNMVVGNVCIDTQGSPTQVYGIKTAGTANRNILVGNKLRGNLTAPYLLSGADDEAVGTSSGTGPLKGTFTLSGSTASTFVVNANVRSDSTIHFFPTNSAAASLMAGSQSLYVSGRTAASGFQVRTGDNTVAAGTETFEYAIL